MIRKSLKAMLLALTLGTLAPLATAADEPIYGSQLMTAQERIEHRNKLQSAQTAEERERIRQEHHEQMQARAREKGITLPDMPPARGGGMGPGMGAGGGGGMGPGRNR